jgi:hypothetical protein
VVREGRERRQEGQTDIARLVIEVIPEDHPEVTVVMSVGGVQELDGVVEHVKLLRIETGDELAREARVAEKDAADPFSFNWKINFKSL